MKRVQIRLAGSAAEVKAARQLVERALGAQVRFGPSTTDKLDENKHLAYGRVYIREPAEPAEPQKEGA